MGREPALEYDGHRLCFGERHLDTLADELGTPFFLVSEGRLRENFAALARGLFRYAKQGLLRYCAKTNNEAGVLRVLRECGSHILVSHPAEAELALACGFTPETVAYQRPILLEEDVSRVVRAGIRYFHAYRPEDLALLGRVADDCRERLTVSLRLRNDSPAVRWSPLNFLSRRLGFSREEILSLGSELGKSPNVSVVALNFYCGTQQDSVYRYRGLLQKAARLTDVLRSRFDVPIEEINLGGGVPSRSLSRFGPGRLLRRLRDRQPRSRESLEEFGAALGREFAAATARLEPPVRLGLEPGRSIVGNAGILVTRVRASQGSWLFLDASRNFLGESPLMFSRVIHPAVLRPGDPKRFYHLSGSTLNTRDVLDFRRLLPIQRTGDVLAFCDSGAYSISRATRYAGLSPAVYLMDVQGGVRMIRRPENLGDLMASMVSAPEPVERSP